MRWQKGVPVLILVGLLALLGYPWGDVPVQAQSPGENWTCSLDDIGATLTRCIVAAEPGSTRYITDIVAQSTTTTGGQWLLQTGTGTNCATGKVSLFPSAATAVRLGSPANTAAPAVFQFKTPIRVPPDKDLCLLGKATDTTTVQISGYVGLK